ncbi:valine--tRNA ligase [Mycobacterium sp. KBS0706]|uniref:valine--tRNA ligase n=1 Tax=Mycobacterium sp. KBS0706 TaxID=2578109 RepID=UPI00110FE085|nr:valine--tRNA ligase [Mycobacterium sp. KBS0706]TSD84870.1 valine--tRNA ligase [Mycobacterium sp. KBS0706]
MLDKTYGPREVEAKLYPEWEQSGAFANNVQSNANPFTIMMPPPNVTGSLHMGHAFNMTLQDVLTRFNRRRGRDALWQPGTDHAGIATQMVVERELGKQGIKRQDLGRDGFLEKVWEWKAQSGGTITSQLRRLGATPNWERERFTMDEGLSRAVVKVFVQLHREGLIYRDKRLVNWDPKLRTSVSDLEVEQKETKGHLWHFRYPIEGEEGRYIVVATTRPETMLGDTAVAVHPDDERYKDLVGKNAVLPLVGRLIPIVADEYSDPEKGSGAVKITPAHDFNDFEVGRRHNLPLINILDEEARLNGEVPEAYRGLDRYEARKRVVADLEALGLVEKIEDHVHAVPHGDRGGVPIEPFLTEQWYLKAEVLAKPAIESVEQGRTVLLPKMAESIFFEWMRNIQPWCISRQLWWGHQIPAWYGPDNAIFVEESEAEAKAAAENHYGEPVELRRETDVLDTWFSSALWPFSTLGWPDQTPELQRYYPGDVLVTGFDIIFFWVARMMMMGIHFMGEVPFRTVYFHSLVRDEKGQKMSKSKGNVIDPLELVDRYGADALRMTLVSLAAGRDIKLGPQQVEGYRNFATKLWNAARFCEMNECRPVPGYDPAANTLTLNRWIVGEVAKTAEKTAAALEGFRFSEAAQVLYQFTWAGFCDWYLEFAKPVFSGTDEAAKAETRATTAWALEQILNLLNPIMPFETEELWRHLADRGDATLVTQPWPDYPAGLVDPQAAAEMDWVIRLISAVRTIRSEMNVPPAAELTATLRDASAETLRRLETHGALIRRLARLASIDPSVAEPAKGSAQAVIDEATLVLPLAGIIDLDKERARLSKEIEKNASEVEKIDRKLGNAQFLEKAPDEVVEEQRERRAEAQAAIEKLQQALARVAG